MVNVSVFHNSPCRKSNADSMTDSQHLSRSLRRPRNSPKPLIISNNSPSTEPPRDTLECRPSECRRKDPPARMAWRRTEEEYRRPRTVEDSNKNERISSVLTFRKPVSDRSFVLESWSSVRYESTRRTDRTPTFRRIRSIPIFTSADRRIEIERSKEMSSLSNCSMSTMCGERRRKRRRRSERRRRRRTILEPLAICERTTRKRTMSKSKDKDSCFSRRRKSRTSRSRNMLDTSSPSSNELPDNSSLDCSVFFVLRAPRRNRSRTTIGGSERAPIREDTTRTIKLRRSSGSVPPTSEFP